MAEMQLPPELAKLSPEQLQALIAMVKEGGMPGEGGAPQGPQAGGREAMMQQIMQRGGGRPIPQGGGAPAPQGGGKVDPRMQAIMERKAAQQKRPMPQGR